VGKSCVGPLSGGRSDSEINQTMWKSLTLGNNIFFEPEIVESNNKSDGEETAINSVVVTEESDQFLKSVECPV
jgi:hypothetical protein